jgi:hypothetical protein
MVGIANHYSTLRNSTDLYPKLGLMNCFFIFVS